MMTYSILGFGDRGQLYNKLLKKNGGAEFIAVCDKDENRIQIAKNEYSVKPEMCYSDTASFFAKGRMSDLLIISTQDQTHYEHAMQAIQVGYDILLEKPMAVTKEQCEGICKKAKEKNVSVYVCYVLRYAPFFCEIKKKIDSGRIGQVVTVNLTENVAYWHQAHSFVRGNWRNSKDSSPMIIAKCCHDMDILSWLADSKALRVSSFGDLSLFKKENAPKDSAEHCFECCCKDTCEYNCLKFYKDSPWWLAKAVSFKGNWENPQDIQDYLHNRNNPYSRCVYKCDNNVVDHQVVNVEFEKGITAHLTMTAFSDESYREIHVHCTKGEIYGSMLDNKLYYNEFGGKKEVIDLKDLGCNDAHGGGDALLVEAIVNSYKYNTKMGKNSINEALQSHLIGFGAEESRVNNGKVVELEL